MLLPQLKFTVRFMPNKKIMALAFIALSAPVAVADTYQVSYSWDAQSLQPFDTPTYGARYRLGGGSPVVLTDTTLPGGGFTFEAAPGTVLEMCPQNKNNPLVFPDCLQAEDWVTVGGAPYQPTMPQRPSGFSATIIRTGP